jgi:phage baseplate assembly protein W
MSDKFLGVPYPLRKDAKGYFYSQGGLNQIKSDLLILLLTNPGERIFLPDYGTPLRKLIFEPNDPSLAIQAREMIITSIQKWEPRISVDQIEVDIDVDKRSLDRQDNGTEAASILMIKILFKDPANMQAVEELKLEVPLGANAS